MTRGEIYRTSERVAEPQFVATLSPARVSDLNRALAQALELPVAPM